jgi:hypothetical protein
LTLAYSILFDKEIKMIYVTVETFVGKHLLATRWLETQQFVRTVANLEANGFSFDDNGSLVKEIRNGVYERVTFRG